MTKLAKKIRNYFILSVWNTFVVYALYTPYVILWLRFDINQFMLWLMGGLPMAMLVGWLIVKLNVWAAKKLEK